MARLWHISQRRVAGWEDKLQGEYPRRTAVPCFMGASHHLRLIPSSFLFEHEAPAMAPDDQLIVTTNKKRLINIYLVRDLTILIFCLPVLKINGIMQLHNAKRMSVHSVSLFLCRV